MNEAMACGLPVISTTAAGCTADLVENNWNGRVIRSGDPDELASAMEYLAGDPVKRSQMGNHSSERILRYSPEACADGIADAALVREIGPHV